MLANACCCDPSCLIDSDDFDRANSNDIGGKWTDANARIVDNRLAQQTLGSMLVMTTKDHTSETMVVDITLAFTPSSISLDKGIVIVNAKDSNNYLFVQIEVSNNIFSGTAVSTKLKFYRRSGGVNTQLGSTRTLDATNALNNQQVRVCYDGTYLKAMGYREAATKITDGFKAGLAAEGSTTIYHDNFRWYKFSPGCPNCNVVCQACSPAIASYILDFGVGGLTDSACTYCNEVVGEFIVTVSPVGKVRACDQSLSNQPALPCYWFYEMMTEPCLSGVCGKICITLILENVGGTNYRWFVGVALCGTIWQAMYRSSTITDCTTTMTLNKTAGENWTGACTGTLPATIEIRAIT